MALIRLMHLRKLAPLSELLGLAEKTAPRTSVPSVPRVPMVPRALVPSVPSVPKVQVPVPTPAGDLKDRLLTEIKSAKSTFYNLVVAQAYRIDVSPSGINFVFQANQKNAKQQADEQRAWVQQVAEKLLGKPVPVTITLAESSTQPAPPPSLLPPRSPEDTTAQAMANATVQAVLEIFPVEKTTVEEV